MAEDLKHFLSSLQTFMACHSIPSLDYFEEKHYLKFLKFFQNEKKESPIIDVELEESTENHINENTENQIIDSEFNDQHGASTSSYPTLTVRFLTL